MDLGFFWVNQLHAAISCSITSFCADHLRFINLKSIVYFSILFTVLKKMGLSPLILSLFNTIIRFFIGNFNWKNEMVLNFLLDKSWMKS